MKLRKLETHKCPFFIYVYLKTIRKVWTQIHTRLPIIVQNNSHFQIRKLRFQINSKSLIPNSLNPTKKIKDRVLNLQSIATVLDPSRFTRSFKIVNFKFVLLMVLNDYKSTSQKSGNYRFLTTPSFYCSFPSSLLFFHPDLNLLSYSHTQNSFQNSPDTIE